MRRDGIPDATTLAQKARPAPSGSTCRRAARPVTAARRAADRAVGAGLKTVDRRRRDRERLVARLGDPKQRPWIYLIVATGDIYEDIPQAQAAARAGADVIAVIRSTGQSLLDYVPEGATPGGLRRHLRHPGELPVDAPCARRRCRRRSGATCG
jgi:beta-lysine 5,6-aminomutase alpha subunit